MNNPNDVKGAFRDGGNTALMGFGMGFTFAGIQEYFNDQKKYINPWTGKPSPVDSPEGYVVSPSKKGNGTLYKDPNNPHNNMRVMPGNSNSPNAAQQNPYVIYKINGVPYDVNGLPLPGANIPDAIFHLMNLI